MSFTKTQNKFSKGIDDKADSTAVTIDDAGNVGIGETSPTTGKLVIRNTNNDEYAIRVGNTAGAGGSVQGITKIGLDAGSSSPAHPHAAIEVEQDGVSGYKGELLFCTRKNNSDVAPIEAMRIDSAGNVGVGTTDPQRVFHAKASQQVTGLFESAGNRCYAGFKDSNTSLSQYGPLIGSSGDSLVIATGASNTPRLTIDATGNVGVGHSSPDAGLTVHNNAGAVIANTDIARQTYTSVGQLQVSTTGAGGILVHTEDDQASGFVGFGDGQVAGRIEYAHSADRMTFMTGSNTRMTVDADGNLLVGASTQVSSETLNVTTSSGVVALFKANQPSSTQLHTAFYNSTGLAAKIDRAGLYTQVSDRSLKHDVSDSTLGLAEVLNIPVRSFKWNGSEDYVAAGFIAQELEQVLPSAVSIDEDSGLKGRSDGNIVPVLVKAIQELSAQVDELKAEVAALEGAN